MSDVQCAWDRESGRWLWGGVASDADAVTSSLSSCKGDPRVVCIGDALFQGLLNNGRCSGLLGSVGLAFVDCEGIGEVVRDIASGACASLIPPSTHTVFLSFGTTDLLQGFHPEQIKDGVLQVAEAIARSNCERMATDTYTRPLQIFFYGVMPASGERCTKLGGASTPNVADYNTQAELLSQLLHGAVSKVDFAVQYPFLASLRMQRMMFVCTRGLSTEPHLYASPLQLNSRGQCVLIGRIVRDVQPAWPGGNPSKDIANWMSQLGLEAEEEAPVEKKEKAGGSKAWRGADAAAAATGSSGAAAATSAEEDGKAGEDSKDEGKGKSWASIAATIRNPTSINPTESSGNFTSYTKLRGINSMLPLRNSSTAQG